MKTFVALSALILASSFFVGRAERRDAHFSQGLAALAPPDDRFYILNLRAQLMATYYERLMLQVTQAYEAREAAQLNDRQREFCLGYWWGYRAIAQQIDMGVTNVTEEIDSRIVHAGWKECNPGQPDLTYP